MESRSRAPDSSLQVLRLPDGVVARAGASATRCPAHPATASAPHRAGGSTHVRSVTLRRWTRWGAVEAPPGVGALSQEGWVMRTWRACSPCSARRDTLDQMLGSLLGQLTDEVRDPDA